MDLSFKQLINNCIVETAHDQIAVSCSVNTKERGGVKKLLGIQAECKVYTVEAMKDEAKITGKTCYKVIYLDKDNQPKGLDYFCDFNESIAGSISPTDRLAVTHSVVDVSGKIDGDEITLTAVCDFLIKVIGSHEGKIVEGVSDLHVQTETMQCVSLSMLKEDTFAVSSEEESGASVNKVLYFGTTPIITAVNESDVGATVEGLVQVEIVYDTESGVKGKTFGIPFSEEIEADNLVDVTASVKSSRLVLSGDEANNVFEVEAFVTISGYDVGVREQEVVVDAFSTTKELSLEQTYLPCRRYTGCKTFDFPVSAEALGDGLPNNAVVLATPVLRVNVANAIAGNNEVTIEGLAVATVLYYNEDRVDSVQVELPFSVTEKAEGINPSDMLTAEAVITDFQANFMSGIINLRAMLKVRICVYTTYRLRWINSIVEGEDKPLNKNGISIYYVGASDSVWDIAKAVNLSPEEVTALNPDLDNTEGSGRQRRVVVFRKR